MLEKMRENMEMLKSQLVKINSMLDTDEEVDLDKLENEKENLQLLINDMNFL